MLNKVDSRIASLVKSLSGDKLDVILIQAEDLMLIEGKTLERALADALEIYKLI